MNYIIRTAYRDGKQLTSAQRSSSHFSPEPRLGTVTIRRGIALTLSEAEFNAQADMIHKLLLAEAITVETDEGNTVVADLPEVPVPAKAAPPPIEKTPEPPPSAPEPVVEQAAVAQEPAPEPTPEPTLETAEEPAPEAVTQPKKKSKRY